MKLDAIVKGDPTDLAGVDFGDQSGDVAGRTPYYLKFTVTGGDGSSALSGDNLDGSAFTGVEPDGNPADWLDIPSGSSFTKCDDPDFPDDFGPGKSARECFPVLASSGGSVDGAAYAQSDSEYESSPITWKQ
ncbi:MAG: hypothetical protein J2O49_08865 [Sciscionella sp.]|nr:hypothetical protein [Sciscionella sp.]